MANPFTIGLSGLKTASRGIATTTHNIANVNTEGYTRQRNIDGTMDPYQTDFGYQGTGVQTQSIERISDAYIGAQLQSQSAELGRISAFQNMAQRTEQLLAGSGLDTAQTDFFNSLEDAANNPHSIAQAEQVLAAASHMTNQFNYLDTQLDTITNDINKSLEAEVKEINQLADSIANLNLLVATARVNSPSVQPNDLLDRRDQMLVELSEHIGTDIRQRGESAIDVATGNGIPLVSIDGAHHLSAIPSATNPTISTVAMETNAGDREVSMLLGGGTISGLVEFQQQVLAPARQLIGRSATVLAENVNRTYQVATGHADATLFTYNAITAYSNGQNTGTGQPTATLLDPDLMSTSDYSISYDGSQYTLTRLTDNESIQGTASLSMDGIQFSVSPGAQAGDRYLVQPNANAAGTLAVSDVTSAALTSLQAGANPIPIVQTLANLRDVNLFDNNTTTLSEQFSSVLIQVGSSARTAINQQESMQNILDYTKSMRESVSSVSLDEEAAALLMYQRNYDASARALAVSNTMFDTLLSALRGM